jgi:hypothetical protein
MHRHTTFCTAKAAQRKENALDVVVAGGALYLADHVLNRLCDHGTQITAANVLPMNRKPDERIVVAGHAVPQWASSSIVNVICRTAEYISNSSEQGTSPTRPPMIVSTKAHTFSGQFPKSSIPLPGAAQRTLSESHRHAQVRGWCTGFVAI